MLSISHNQTSTEHIRIFMFFLELRGIVFLRVVFTKHESARGARGGKMLTQV